jgi:phosphoribosylaminoimidazolecarboxamide formyltransferase / IMP cyclohydrolase
VAATRRALVSVTDKTGVVEFAAGLEQLGFSILSTGGTAKVLSEAGVKVTPLQAFTGFPEMLDGRVKTLHPRVHGGILARRDLAQHQREMEQHGLDPIDVVCVNLYDFDGAIAKPDISFEDAIEQIDIGGPTLLRAAAKNHAFVLPVVDPADYSIVLKALASSEVEPSLRKRLALEVFRHTARYDRAIADWLGRQIEEREFSTIHAPAYELVQELRYGENPHQVAALYRDQRGPSHLTAARVLQGKELSYNNLLDLDAALGLAIDLPEGCAVYIKHNNPCGVAQADSPKEALRKARECDPLSAFGAVVALNVPVDRAAAATLNESFVEAIIAPSYEENALELLSTKKNLRVLSLPGGWSRASGFELRLIRGGALLQTRDDLRAPLEEVRSARVVTKRTPSDDELAALGFTWTVAKHVRSNAIVFGRADRVVAVGAGQMSRVDSVKICKLKNPDGLKGTAVASDAFFPFRDGIDELAAAGASAIVQPGGSVRDEEVIRAADEHGVAMVFTGVRHFRH